VRVTKGIPLGLFGPGNDFTFKVLQRVFTSLPNLGPGFIYFLGSKLYFHGSKEIGISKNAFLFCFEIFNGRGGSVRESKGMK
jgi:hypothetical protein